MCMRVCRRRTGRFSIFLALRLSGRSTYVPQLVFPSAIFGVSLSPMDTLPLLPSVRGNTRLLMPQCTTTTVTHSHYLLLSPHFATHSLLSLSLSLSLSVYFSPSVSVSLSPSLSQQKAEQVRTTYIRVSRVDSWCLSPAGTRVSVAVGFGEIRAPCCVLVIPPTLVLNGTVNHLLLYPRSTTHSLSLFFSLALSLTLSLSLSLSLSRSVSLLALRLFHTRRRRSGWKGRTWGQIRYVPQRVFPASIVRVCRLQAPWPLLPSVLAKFPPPVDYLLRTINTRTERYSQPPPAVST